MRRLQPPGWPEPRGYANGMLAEGRARVRRRPDRLGLAPASSAADLPGQVRQTLLNIVAVLAEADARPEHVARLTWYVIDRDDYLAQPEGDRRGVSRRHGPPLPGDGRRAGRRAGRGRGQSRDRGDGGTVSGGSISVQQRADRERVDDRAEARPCRRARADGEHAELDAGADHADRAAGAAHEAGHQPVARAGAEAGADVGARPRRALRTTPAASIASWTAERRAGAGAARARVDRDADHEHVADRPEPGPLAQRDPGEQHERAVMITTVPNDRPVRVGDALVEDVPRVEARARRGPAAPCSRRRGRGRRRAGRGGGSDGP